MIQRRQHFRFALEPRHALRVSGKRLGKDFQRHLAPERRSRARYTSPIPPAPRSPQISYCPSLLPAAIPISGAIITQGILCPNIHGCDYALSFLRSDRRGTRRPTAENPSDIQSRGVSYSSVTKIAGNRTYGRNQLRHFQYLPTLWPKTPGVGELNISLGMSDMVDGCGSRVL